MSFRSDLESLLNQHTQENGSDTPDFVLAEFLVDCLKAFDSAVNAREKWYGREKKEPTTEAQQPGRGEG